MPNITLDQIIANLERSITEDHTGASRITMSNNDLLSLLRAIRDAIK